MKCLSPIQRLQTSARAVLCCQGYSAQTAEIATLTVNLLCTKLKIMKETSDLPCRIILEQPFSNNEGPDLTELLLGSAPAPGFLEPIGVFLHQ